MYRNIKKEIINLIKPINSNVSFDLASEVLMFPHVTCHLGPSYVREGLHSFLLDVDVWDRSQSTEKVDSLAELISEKLDRTLINFSGLNITIWYTGMNSIEDTDKTIKRKTCSFELQARKDK